jgi:enoyl-CoA hydratase
MTVGFADTVAEASMLEQEDIDGVAVVRLAHGPVNALDLELLNAITDTFTALDTGPFRAVVLTGRGRAFSAGVDLWRILDGGPDYIRAFLPALSDAFLAVFDVGKPVVVAVNGHAIAGGAVLASAGDYRIMAEGGGRVGVPELHVGVPFPVTALEVLSFTMGERRARESVFAAATYPAREALLRRFVDDLVPAEDLLDGALQAAIRLATEIPADTYRLTKAALRAGAHDRLVQLRPRFDPTTEQLWLDRAADGWIRQYLERATGRR